MPVSTCVRNPFVGSVLSRLLALTAMVLVGLASGFAAEMDRASMPRTIITTDSEADDINSFIRLLYYANELDMQGLVYTSSVHHWKGDGVRTLQQAHAAGTVPRTARPGERLVVVASVVDGGTPALTRYAQFVITVTP